MLLEFGIFFIIYNIETSVLRGLHMTLAAWRKKRLPCLSKREFVASVHDNVTIVIYHFWSATETDTRFAEAEFSILQTWLWCGKLPVRIITNKQTSIMHAFARKHKEVEVIESPRLVPGSIPSMSLDMVGFLSDYFETAYVLIIQNDGFPLRKGLDSFIHKYTYWGAPFVKESLKQAVLERFISCSVGNGGFSLRHRNVCVEANRLWLKWEWLLKDTRWMTDDAYYCIMARVLGWKYRRLINFPSRKEAFDFGYDMLTGVPVPDQLPFGVHGANSFQALYEKFGPEIDRMPN